jgi:tRNA U34 5-methylaminomethyl-2-thiouridine-forming methyltransferase MnmC
MKIEIRETMDGSKTLYLEEIDEHYHSTFGAVQESQHVFIREGFSQCPAKEIRVLEIGFGTGLNCYMTLMESLKREKITRYYSIEKFPLAEAFWGNLNYHLQVQDGIAGLFELLHKVPWDCEVEICSQFSLNKIKGDALQLDFIDLPKFDVVYFDAFSPEKQPELWEKPLFERLFAMMNEQGILVTYCAKGIVRRALQSVGFAVERIPGPPGKREMIRAVKRIKDPSTSSGQVKAKG